MKFRTTRKKIMSNYDKVVKVGFCNLQNLLMFENPIAYWAGADGWHADIYDVDGVAIVTGYQPFGNIVIPSETLSLYDSKAMEAWNEKHDAKEVKKALKAFVETVKIWEK